QERRQAILEKWCANPKGESTDRIAQAIYEKISEKSVLGPQGRLTFTEFRKGLKLIFKDCINKPYHWNPTVPVRAFFRPEKTLHRVREQKKAIHPQEARDYIAWLRGILRG
ncbi:MAG: hypothetical protein HQL67_07080, partial [Magnetococcales bacterium]|nr:hypothetical protein [Magnetococcales bacterium]